MFWEPWLLKKGTFVFPLAGTLCIASPFARVRSGLMGGSGKEGRIHWPLDTTQIPLGSGPAPILPGETWYFQGWFRDGLSSNFTDAVSVLFL